MDTHDVLVFFRLCGLDIQDSVVFGKESRCFRMLSGIGIGEGEDFLKHECVADMKTEAQRSFIAVHGIEIITTCTCTSHVALAHATHGHAATHSHSSAHSHSHSSAHRIVALGIEHLLIILIRDGGCTHLRGIFGLGTPSADVRGQVNELNRVFFLVPGLIEGQGVFRSDGVFDDHAAGVGDGSESVVCALDFLVGLEVNCPGIALYGDHCLPGGLVIVKCLDAF